MNRPITDILVESGFISNDVTYTSLIETKHTIGPIPKPTPGPAPTPTPFF